VRLAVIVASVVVMATAPALASPRHLRYLVKLDEAVAREVPRTRTVRAVPDVREIQHVAPRVRLTYPAPKKLGEGEIEMPWIWQVLRERVVSRLPSYEEERRFTVVLSPVVVSTPSDTVPGLGIAGDF
jgi:hypothetical protein